jgi:esterase
VDICPVSYDHGRHDEVIDAMEGLPLASLSGRKQADQLLREKIVEADIRQFLLSNLYQKQGSWSWRCNLVALSSNRHALAMAPTGGGAYPGPTLFIKGANSDYIGEHCGEAISRQFPQAQLRIISAAGHWPHAEKPVTFNGVVSRFLHRVYPAQSGDRA